MAITKDSCSYGYDVIEDAPCRIASAVDLRLDLFDDDASPAFNRFHITQILRFDFAFPWYACSPHFTCV